MKKLDFVIIIVALATACGLYFSGVLRADKPGATAVIYVDGKAEMRLSLSKEMVYTVETPTGWNVVEIDAGLVRVSDSDCRDKVCVNHKSINKINESIVCLPHKVVVEIEGGEVGGVDAVAQ